MLPVVSGNKKDGTRTGRSWPQHLRLWLAPCTSRQSQAHVAAKCQGMPSATASAAQQQRPDGRGKPTAATTVVVARDADLGTTPRALSHRPNKLVSAGGAEIHARIRPLGTRDPSHAALWRTTVRELAAGLQLGVCANTAATAVFSYRQSRVRLARQTEATAAPPQDQQALPFLWWPGTLLVQGSRARSVGATTCQKDEAMVGWRQQ